MSTYISLSKYVKLHSFKDGSDNCLCSFFCQETWVFMCVWECQIFTASVLHQIHVQACTWAFCKSTPLALSTRHRFTVAGNYERLFLFIYFCCLFLLYSQQQNCYMKCAWKPTVYYLGYDAKITYCTINCISFLGGTKGTFMKGLIHRRTYQTSLKCMFSFKNIFHCINKYEVAQVQETEGPIFKTFNSLWCSCMLFICKYLQTYVYS